MIWKPIPGWDYEASDCGQIRSLAVLRPLKAWRLNNDYWQVALWDKNRKKNFCVHRLVCRAFHGEPPTAKHHAAHRDGNKNNNHKDNIRWATAKENAKDKIIHGTLPLGEKCGAAKLTEQQVLFIRQSKAMRKDLAAKFNINLCTVTDIRLRRTWAHV